MNALWIAFMIVFVSGKGPMPAMAQHEPFETEEQCQSWLKLHEPDTQEWLARMIDQGVPVIGHAGMCVLPEDMAPKKPA